MKNIFFCILLFYFCFTSSCNHPDGNKSNVLQDYHTKEGEFGYDLQFLKEQDSTLVVLKDGDAQLIVSPKYQAKVFTSTAQGEHGLSFGWINYRAFRNKTDAHMNAYGGENRFWLGPEGGKFSLFFQGGSKMVFDNWKTPPAFDTERWIMKTRDSNSVTLIKEMNLINYSGSRFMLRVNRKIKILGKQEIILRTGISGLIGVQVIGYETENLLTNTGVQEWTARSGMPCIWILDMFKPSPSTIIVVPFHYQAGEDFTKIATTNYFGEIPADRIRHSDSLLLFKADGKSRGKLGIVANKAKHMAGSYDVQNKVLTIIQFDVEVRAKYLNQEWKLTKPPFSGDAVNAYNDGPLADGSQMGPFYEIESVSPAAFLKPDETLMHTHSVFHFLGGENEMNQIAIKLLGISLDSIRKML